MHFEKRTARSLPLYLVSLVLTGSLALAASAGASVGPAKAKAGPPKLVPNSRGAIAAAEFPRNDLDALGPSLIGPPRCQLEVTQQSYRAGDTVRASLHLSNPTPAAAQVEMKIWFSAPGEVALSLADPAEAGRSLELPGMLNRDSGSLRLFAVDDSTPRGTYEMNCRLIDPVTGSLLSEDLNAFQVD